MILLTICCSVNVGASVEHLIAQVNLNDFEGWLQFGFQQTIKQPTHAVWVILY